MIYPLPPPRGYLPTACTICGAPLLNPHELTGLCLEDKVIARYERWSAEQAAIQDQGRTQAVAGLITQIGKGSRQPEEMTP
jgi:hypothetical protein